MVSYGTGVQPKSVPCPHTIHDVQCANGFCFSLSWHMPFSCEKVEFGLTNNSLFWTSFVHFFFHLFFIFPWSAYFPSVDNRPLQVTLILMAFLSPFVHYILEKASLRDRARLWAQIAGGKDLDGLWESTKWFGQICARIAGLTKVTSVADEKASPPNWGNVFALIRDLI